MASGIPEAAICVQDIDVQCVLQFTLLHAAGCALHRHTSRVIHRLEFCHVYLSKTHTRDDDDVDGRRRRDGKSTVVTRRKQNEHAGRRVKDNTSSLNRRRTDAHCRRRTDRSSRKRQRSERPSDDDERLPLTPFSRTHARHSRRSFVGSRQPTVETTTATRTHAETESGTPRRFTTG